MELDLTQVRHPDYLKYFTNWIKFRFVFQGGDAFIDTYLEKFSSRETNDDFASRKRVTYSPSFGKSSVIEIRDSIYQRMNDISRIGGHTTYQDAIKGLNGGVDREGSSMNLFVGTKILQELLVMSKVGVMVDMPELSGNTMAAQYGKHPYFYYYAAEDILSWDGEYFENEYWYTKLLLRDNIYTYDENTGLPKGSKQQFRLMLWTEEGVLVKFMDLQGKENKPPVLLKINRIPFVCFEISHSLLEDVANYQIALLNLSSSDIYYALKSNYPFYTEQYEPRGANVFGATTTETSGDSEEKIKEVQVGVTGGRQYPRGLERPGFIHPSPEPLKASMEKQEQMKKEIRQLVHLALNNVQPKFASSESKKMDERSLEAGLSYIGLELETGERKLAWLWNQYLGEKKQTTINYPNNYSLKSESDRQEEANGLKEQMTSVPSLTFKKIIAKRLAKVLLGTSVSNDDLNKIEVEIDAAPYITSDPLHLEIDLRNHLCTRDTASKARGYADGEAEKAHKERIEDLALIQAAQTGPDGDPPKNPAARGLPDGGGSGKDGDNGRPKKE